MTPEPDERVGRLYGLPLDEFTPARNVLAKELRAEGDRDAAQSVRALRKPSRAAWAVNQLVRAEPELVEALLGAGGELRQAHRQAASGRGAEQLRGAAEAERAAVDRLMARAPDVLGEAPGAALADAMRNTLHAASSDDEARELIGEARLVDAVRPVGLGPVPAGLRMPPTASGKAGRKPAAADAARAEAEAQAAEARRRREHARLLKSARADETALRREADAAGRSLERADQGLVRAREAAEAATERAKDARRRARTARTALADAERRVARLERDVPES
jgi:hypothetical protein